MDKLSCTQIAEMTGGKVLNNCDIVVSSVASLEDATETQLSFLGNSKYSPQVPTSNAGIIIIPEDYRPEDDKCYIVCQNPSAGFSTIIDTFAPAPIEFQPGVHPNASIAKDATIGENCHIGANAVIESMATIGANTIIAAGTVVGHEVSIGENCHLHPNVTIRERCIIGNRCIIHSATAIGSDGFGFIPGSNGHKKIPQVGNVVLEDDVEVGSCVCIDRARFGKTKIGQGTKIDNLVQIAHNVEIGAHCFIVSQSGIAGSTKLGDFVIMAAQAGIAGHINVGNGVTMAGRAGVTKDIADGSKVFGFPAVSKREFIKQGLAYKKVERLENDLAELKKQINELKND
jgi:UDP-3-O-[3-hydroxymyristoyl] glucosamine N-acyltransferase